jgi:protein-disulfide isomerase
MTRHQLFALPVSLAILGACSQGAEAPASVDRMARSEVEAIVKDYLIQNPEVLSEAIDALQAHEQKKLFTQLASSGDDPSLGPKDAPITIVEFFDYNCGYCKLATDWVFEAVDSRQGDVRVVFKEYPILAESSLLAAKAALAADKQGKYREMHVALMKAKTLDHANIDKIAASIGLDVARLRKDMESDAALEHVQRIHAEAEQAQIQGTPGFFINGEPFSGFQKETLDKMLAEARKAAKAG